KPGLFEAERGSGQAHEMLGQADRAIASYQRALAIKGDDVTVLNNLAWLLAEARRSPEEALPLASKAVQLAPQSPEIADTLAWIHYRRGKYADAEKLLVPAAERAPKNAIIQYHLGMTYYRLGKKGDAASTLRRAANLDPKLAEREKLNDLIKQVGG
ncbi:MAG: tetratricopeptide repeat protein, partial [Candidatus Rokubacteria bacterium]|nr:tetratricopeptide repeat protein [Candidatus Rokubacteria bacterium]